MTHKELKSLGLHMDVPQWELDIVCGMDVDPRTTPYSYEYKDTVYYFCNASCLKHFVDDPQQYAG